MNEILGIIFAAAVTIAYFNWLMTPSRKSVYLAEKYGKNGWWTKQLNEELNGNPVHVTVLQLMRAQEKVDIEKGIKQPRTLRKRTQSPSGT